MKSRVGNGFSDVVVVYQPGVPYRLSKRAAVCRILDDQCRVHCGTAGNVEAMEIRDGEEGPMGEHGKHEGYGDWH